MDRINKNKSRNLTDFLRYHKGEMSGEERNSFERELQKDPFAEEAVEGFSHVTTEEAENDLLALKKKAGRKIHKRSLVIYYRVAAAIAVLVTISVIYFSKKDSTEEITLSKNFTEELKTPLTIPASEPFKDKTEKAEARDIVQSPVLPLSPSPNRLLTPSPTLPDIQQLAIASDNKPDADACKEEIEQVMQVAEDDNLLRPSEAEKKMEMSRMAGVVAPMAAKSIIAGHIPPQPVTGMDSFNIYLEKNIRNPEPDNNNEEIVIISFKVMTDSSLTDLKIISSPGAPFSKEAKRLIKDGPAWKPAMIDRTPVEEEYRITIRFR